MAKYKSRATRAGEAEQAITSAAEDLGTLQDTIKEELYGDETKFEAPSTEVIEEWAKTIQGINDKSDEGKSEIDTLADEMRQWEENTAEKFSQTSKYETISSTADALESARDELDGADWPSMPDHKGTENEWETFLSGLEDLQTLLDDQASEVGGCEFPGMYG